MTQKRALFLLIACLFAGYASLTAQSVPVHTTLTPVVPADGQTVTIEFNAAGTPLQNMKNVSAVAYCFINYAWQAEDVAMTSNAANQWQGSFAVPQHCAFTMFKFVAGDSVYNNKADDYGVFVHDHTDTTKNIPGGYAAWGMFRSRNYGFDIPGYLGDDDYINDTVTNFWLQKELSIFHAEGRDALAVPYALSVYNSQGESGMPVIDGVVKYLTRTDAPEEDLLKARYILAITNNTKREDSLSAAIGKKFPESNLDKLKLYQQMTAAKDPKQQAKLCQIILQKYPYDKALHWFDEQNNIRYTSLYLIAMLPQAMNKDYSKVEAYTPELPYNEAFYVYDKLIAIQHLRKDTPDSILYEPGELLCKRILSFKDHHPAYDADVLSPSEWMKRFNNYFLNSVLNIQIDIAKNTGHYNEALQYAIMAEDILQYARADVNNDYVFLLMKNGEDKKANEVLVKSMYQNQASPEMIELLKQNFSKQNGSEAGFADYLQSLKNAALSEHNEIAAGMLNQPMVAFSMLDSNDKPVSLSSLKGKTVVLDFWATWCVPCKASFPGMKLAVDKYKSDSSVVFYFVDTEERSKTYKDENRQYLKDNNYNFNLLFDNPSPASKSNDEVFSRICKAFTISGIPQKIIIDKNGNVRFITVGYKGSASELADEISDMIELTKTTN